MTSPLTVRPWICLCWWCCMRPVLQCPALLQRLLCSLYLAELTWWVNILLATIDSNFQSIVITTFLSNHCNTGTNENSGKYQIPHTPVGWFQVCPGEHTCMTNSEIRVFAFKAVKSRYTCSLYVKQNQSYMHSNIFWHTWKPWFARREIIWTKVKSEQMMTGQMLLFVILIRLQRSQVKRKTLGWPKCMSREHPFMLRSPPHGMSFDSQFRVKFLLFN